MEVDGFEIDRKFIRRSTEGFVEHGRIFERVENWTKENNIDIAKFVTESESEAGSDPKPQTLLEAIISRLDERELSNTSMSLAVIKKLLD
jgi:hypothetical protein